MWAVPSVLNLNLVRQQQKWDKGDWQDQENRKEQDKQPMSKKTKEEKAAFNSWELAWYYQLGLWVDRLAARPWSPPVEQKQYFRTPRAPDMKLLCTGDEVRQKRDSSVIILCLSSTEASSLWNHKNDQTLCWFLTNCSFTCSSFLLPSR